MINASSEYMHCFCAIFPSDSTSPNQGRKSLLKVFPPFPCPPINQDEDNIPPS